MTLHLEEGLDLAEGQVLSVPERDQFVKGAEEIVGIAENFPLIEALACVRHHLGEEVEGVNVLQDVGLLVRDEDHVELVKGLVDKSDVVLLDRGMLGSTVCQLGKRGEESFYARPWHFAELPRQDSLPPAGADRGGEDNLQDQPLAPRSRIRAPQVLVGSVPCWECVFCGWTGDNGFGCLTWPGEVNSRWDVEVSTAPRTTVYVRTPSSVLVIVLFEKYTRFMHHFVFCLTARDVAATVFIVIYHNLNHMLWLARAPLCQHQDL